MRILKSLLLGIFFGIIVSLLMVDLSLADDWSLRGGAAINKSSLTGSSKVFGIRHEADFFYALRHAEEIGGFVDNLGKGRSGAVLGKAQLGVSPGPDTGVYASLFSGVCGLSATDSQLGSFLQFCTDLGLGIRDQYSFVRVSYDHISDAGIKLPNAGRDFVSTELGIRF